MSVLPLGHLADPSLRVLHLPLDAIGSTEIVVLSGGEGLPEGAVDVPSARLLLAATPCAAPLFSAAVTAAALRRNEDALLIRTGLRPESEDEVTCAVALMTSAEVFAFDQLLLWRSDEGALWLVPKRQGPFIHICCEGLRMELASPYDSWAERSDGLCRAAAEIVRLPLSIGRR